MKYFLAALTGLSIIWSTAAQALPAHKWNCYGQDQYYNHGVEFSIIYEDWSAASGYATQELSITNGSSYDLTAQPNCQAVGTRNYAPEVNLTFAAEDSAYSSEGIRKVNFFAACEAEVSSDLIAFCKKIY